MNKNELQAEIKRKGHTYETLSKVLGISHNALSRKMNGMNDFTLPEIQGLVLELNLCDSILKAIFFN